jgi:hypothetical protein
MDTLPGQVALACHGLGGLVGYLISLPLAVWLGVAANLWAGLLLAVSAAALAMWCVTP